MEHPEGWNKERTERNTGTEHKEQGTQNDRKAPFYGSEAPMTRSYTRSGHLTAFIPSPCAKVLQCWGILDSTLHRYPTHILSPNHCHHMCLWHGIGTETSLKWTIIDTDSRFHCFYVVNFCQTPSMIEVFWILLHTDTPHIFCLPTTAIECVFVIG